MDVPHPVVLLHNCSGHTFSVLLTPSCMHMYILAVSGCGVCDICCWQGRASAVFVWKADQRYPIALFEQGEGVEVPAVAIERTPWGQQPANDAVRLASCTNTDKVCKHCRSRYKHCATCVLTMTLTRYANIVVPDKDRHTLCLQLQDSSQTMTVCD